MVKVVNYVCCTIANTEYNFILLIINRSELRNNILLDHCRKIKYNLSNLQPLAK